MEKRIQPGIYEQVINEDFAEKLAQIADNFKDIAPIDQEEGAGILTAYLRRIIDQGLAITAEQAGKKDPKRQLAAQIELANQIIELIQQQTKNDALAGERVALQGEQLLALLPDQNNLRVLRPKAVIPRPETSLIETSRSMSR